MRKIRVVVLMIITTSGVLFANITLPYTGIELPVPEGGKWDTNDLTDTFKKNLSFLVSIDNDIIQNCYMYPEKADSFDDNGFFFLLSEFSDMHFVFGWSAMRLIAIDNTTKEVQKFYQDHVENAGGSGLKILKKDKNNKTGEYFFEYTWKDKNGEKVYGRSYGTFYHKKTLITMSLEWKNKESKELAKQVLNEYVKKLEISYPVNV